MNGLKKAILYSLKPHELGYCGPQCVKDSKNILKKYLLGDDFPRENIVNLLNGFKGATSYYSLLAKLNNIKNIYDEKIVEAYWVGNELSNSVTTEDLKKMILYNFVGPDLLTKDKAKSIIEKIPEDIIFHHSFHVFFVSAVSGRVSIVRQKRDECKVSWGEVIDILKDRKKIRVKTKKLFPEDKKEIKTIDLNEQFVPRIKERDLVSFHWGRVSEKLSQKKFNNLVKYTKINYNAYKKAYGVE